VTDHSEDSNITKDEHCINNACLAAVARVSMVRGTEKQYPDKNISSLSKISI
jgi:hypothetical protein